MKYAELEKIYHQPFFDLLKQARNVHETYWPEDEVQLCTLLSIKTGGCSEDCSYCSQSARYLIFGFGRRYRTSAGPLAQNRATLLTAFTACVNGVSTPLPAQGCRRG